MICFFWIFSLKTSIDVPDSFNLYSSALIIIDSSYLPSSFSASFFILSTSFEVNEVNGFLFFWSMYYPNLELLESDYGSSLCIKLTSLLDILEVPFSVSSNISEKLDDCGFYYSIGTDISLSLTLYAFKF